ncbi:hypothetical protein HK100_008673 [Physocladia obscura]|uniref:cAMP-dependent protein kinase regulatory subunit n=1 Tax=Physocladia obscura TaxID=109957 RepID=A0AAD5XFF5_9FUNG|nr:hypothetical protein HK100_008673 [Physocladia obscura]
MEIDDELNEYYDAAERLMNYKKSFDEEAQINKEMRAQANMDFRVVLEAASGNEKLKSLAARGIPQYFQLCPELQFEALDRHLDLCEDDSTIIRYAAIGQLYHFVDKQLSDLPEKAVDILLQLLQTNLTHEFLIVKTCLAQSLLRNASITIATTWSHLASDITSPEFLRARQFAIDTFLGDISRGCDNANLISHLEGIDIFFAAASESVINNSEYFNEWIDEDGLTNLMEPILRLTCDPARTSVREIANYLSRILCSSIEVCKPFDPCLSTAVEQLFTIFNAIVQLCKQHSIKPVSFQNFLLKRVLSNQLLSKFTNSDKELSVLKIFAESVTFGGEFDGTSWINSLLELAKRHIHTDRDDHILSSHTYQKLGESSPFISSTADTTFFLKSMYTAVMKLRGSYAGMDAIPTYLENIFTLVKELLRSPERRTPHARFKDSFEFSWNQSATQKSGIFHNAVITGQQEQQLEQKPNLKQNQKTPSKSITPLEYHIIAASPSARTRKEIAIPVDRIESGGKNFKKITPIVWSTPATPSSTTEDTLLAQSSVDNKLTARKKIPISERIGRKSISTPAEILQPLLQSESKHSAPLSPPSQSSLTASSALLLLNQSHLQINHLNLTVPPLEPALPQQIRTPPQIETTIVGKRKADDAVSQKPTAIKRVTKRGGIFLESIKGIPSVQISDSAMKKHDRISTASMAGDRKNRTNNIHDGSNMESDFAVPAEFPEILKDLNREVLRAQPKDIYQFCATYFHTKLAEQRKELIELAAGIVPEDEVDDGRLNSKILTNIRERKDSDNEIESEDDEESEEEASAPPPVTTNYNRGRRTSVSAESMAPSLDKDFVAVIIPKTDEQKQRIQVSIKNNFLFRSCDEEQYRDVVDAMAEKRVAAGEEVIRQGGIGDFFYVVETGALDVFVSKNGNPPVKVFEYTDGGSFGELALMYNAPRAATVVATADSVLWALDRVTFRRILMENTSRKRRMYEGFLEEVKLLSSLEPYERHKIADVLESQVYNNGETVIKQGDVGEQFYIIESGEASVSKVVDGVQHEYPGLKKGDYFGELALLTEQPRQATIRAIGRLKVATMGKKAFVRLLGPVVDIIKRNANDYAKIKSHIPSN